MTTVYLIRHAEAEGNLYRRIHGWYDSLVTENGKAQIEALYHRFRDIPVDGVYSSDLHRTQATAQAIVVPKELPLYLHPGLREVSMGAWEDKTWGDIGHRDGEALAQFTRSDPAWQAPHGESLAQVGLRMERALGEIVRRHPDQCVAVFSHGMAIRQVVANLRGVSPSEWHTLPHSDNTAVSCLAWDGGRFHVVYEGDNSHLDDSISTLARQSWWRKGGQHAPDVNFWFRPLSPAADRELYQSARRDAWISVYGAQIPFDGDAFWGGACAALERDRDSCWVAMSGDRLAGVVQCSPTRFSEEGAGFLSFGYLTPEFRYQGLGAQLLGQAISYFRRRGRNRLRVRCAAQNQAARRFYTKHGFAAVGQEELGGQVALLLERSITRPPLFVKSGTKTFCETAFRLG